MSGPVSVDRELCKACGICIELCPEKVFDADKSAYPVVERPADCTQCLLCELHCPDFAIEVKRRAKKRAAEPPAVDPAVLATVSERCSHDGEDG
jgi:2-oxoglutarate ferredoxin oxidoreductase subunit delta